jgi:hypothetical protein
VIGISGARCAPSPALAGEGWGGGIAGTVLAAFPHPALRATLPRKREKEEKLALSDHHLAHHAAAIHLVFEVDHRRPGEVPGQA